MDIEKIGSLWIEDNLTSKTLQKHSIDKKFFLKHFGSKILKNINSTEDYPIMYVFTKFFKSKKIFFYEVEDICFGLIRTLKKNLPEEEAIKYEMLLKEKLESIREDIEFDNPFVLDAHLTDDNERLKDIRFSTKQDLSAKELEELLDDALYNKIELFQEQLDKLIFLLDELENKDAKTIHKALPKITSKYALFKELVDTMTLFPVIVKSFHNLINFLENLELKTLEDSSKKELLVIMLGGLNADISNWIDTVFIKKEADDIYYFDASFANNCLEIELQCGKTRKEEENIDIEEELVSAEDLMFFDL